MAIIVMRKSPSPRAAIHTHGCRLNQSESVLLRERLRAEGYEVVPWGEPADLGIINTCTVTREAEAKCRQTIRGFQRTNPDAFTAVVGCYSQTGAKALAEIPGVDLIVGNQEKLSVLDYIGEERNPHPVIVRERIDREDFSIAFVGDTPFQQRANLKIQDGCDFFCSFCIIPMARGRARSRHWDNLLAEAENLVARGVRELVLTGVNLGTYLDHGRDIVAVVDALDKIPGLNRVRISSIEPTTVPLPLLERMADTGHTLMPFLHLPLQSGCNRILQEMRRRYTVHDYEAFVDEAMGRVPDLCLGTDILVGFPGETDEEFAQTCRFFEQLPFAYTHVFTYSERDGTLAARRQGEMIPVPKRNRRGAKLRRLSAIRQREFHRSHLGQVSEVLFEDPKEGGWPGLTRNYIRVRVESPENLRNRRALVRLDHVAADFVEGTLIEVLDPA